MRSIAVVVLGVAAASAYAFRLDVAGSWKCWGAMGATYAALGAFALYKMWDDGTLFDRLRPRWGDLSVGALTAMLLLFASWGARAVLAPFGTPRHLWLLRSYAQLGDPEMIQRSVALTSVVLLTPLFEEIVWRGHVLAVLEERLGSRRAWPVAALLYGVAVGPSLFALAVPGAGPNPLVVIATLGSGLVWSFTAMMMQRLPPVIISHVAFLYFSVMQFRSPGI